MRDSQHFLHGFLRNLEIIYKNLNIRCLQALTYLMYLLNGIFDFPYMYSCFS